MGSGGEDCIGNIGGCVTFNDRRGWRTRDLRFGAWLQPSNVKFCSPSDAVNDESGDDDSNEP